MILSSIVYLAVRGQDLGLAAEQIIQGLYDSFILLAVPLFIVAANIMNAGTISERLLNFCLARSAGSAAARPGQRRRQPDFLRHVGLGRRRRRRHRQDHHRHDEQGRSLLAGYAAAITAASATIGPIIPPSIPMVLYALVSDTSIGYLFLGGIIPGADHGRRADG